MPGQPGEGSAHVWIQTGPTLTLRRSYATFWTRTDTLTPGVHTSQPAANQEAGLGRPTPPRFAGGGSFQFTPQQVSGAAQRLRRCIGLPASRGNTYKQHCGDQWSNSRAAVRSLKVAARKCQLAWDWFDSPPGACRDHWVGKQTWFSSREWRRMLKYTHIKTNKKYSCQKTVSCQINKSTQLTKIKFTFIHIFPQLFTTFLLIIVSKTTRWHPTVDLVFSLF